MNIFYINIILTIILVFFVMILIHAKESMVLTLDVANIGMRLSSMLTEYARNFLISGNQKYRDKYFEIENIRNGVLPFDIILKHPWFKNKISSITDLYKKLNFDQTDLKFFNEAREQSEQLMWDEISAMNYREGYVDENGEAKNTFDAMIGGKKFIQFSKKIEDPEELKKLHQNGVDLLYSKDYLERVGNIQILYQKGVELAITRKQSEIDNYKILVYILLGVFITFNVYISRKHSNSIISHKRAK